MRKTKKTRNQGHERSISSYERIIGKRSPGRCILIVCEGAETEPNYFEELRKCLKLSIIQVKVKERGGAPISLVDTAQHLVEQRRKEVRDGKLRICNYEAVWCVFDVENPRNNTSFNDAVNQADSNQFSLAISNPAFEFWYVLHFEDTSRPFADGRELKKYLEKFIPGYCESSPVFCKIKENTFLAIKRAKKTNQNRSVDRRFPNPSSGVYEIVEELIKMSPSGSDHLLKQSNDN